MNIKELELVNFRNYTAQKAAFDKGVNVFYGNNAQGKTNLLEAIFVCAIGKSHRSVPDREMIKQGAGYASISAVISAFGREYTVECVISTNKKKLIKVNGVALERASELIGMFNAVLFTPDDMSIITGGPGLRRKMLDMFISQLRPVYLSSLISYNRALEQKTRLLKTLDNKPSLADTLEIWNTELAQYGAVIIKYRAEYIKKLTSIMGDVHSDITCGGEISLISYLCSIKAPIEVGVRELQDALANEIRHAAKRELEQKTALVGPHRDDLLFYVKQDKAKNFASRGQCRTVILSLRLAQLEVIMRERGEYPVLLLDDITSELDCSRRQYLFDRVKGMQAIITCTDADLMGNENGARFFKIDNGVVSGR